MSHLAVLEAKHVQYPDEAVSGVSEGLTEYGEGLAGLLAACSAHSGGVKARHLVVDGLVGAHRAGEGGPLETVGSLDDCGDRPAVESLGQGVTGRICHVGVRGRLDQVTPHVVGPGSQTLVELGRGHTKQLGDPPQLLLAGHVQLQAVPLGELEVAKEQDGRHHLQHVHAGDAEYDQVRFPRVESLPVLVSVCPGVPSVEVAQVHHGEVLQPQQAPLLRAKPGHHLMVVMLLSAS